MMLRRFLEYASDPAMSFDGAPTTANAYPTGDDINVFEAAVKTALEARGHRVAPQIGSAGYIIDLAILSEDGARYDLGIECDGRIWHSAEAARDRDWLRQGVLEGLGWEIHRVWSTSWIRNPADEIEKVERSLARARSLHDVLPLGNTGGESIVEEGRSDAVVPQKLTDKEEPTEGLGQVEVAVAANDPIELSPYIMANLKHQKIGPQLAFETFKNISALVTAVVEVEGPVHQDVIIERLRVRYNMGKVRGSTRDHVAWMMKRSVTDGHVRADNLFLFADDNQLERAPRLPGDRDIDHYSPREMLKVVVACGAAYPTAREALIIEVSRHLGFGRTGAKLTERLNGAIDHLIASGYAEDGFGGIRILR
jgi:very-short-patch-repair endonuclease